MLYSQVSANIQQYECSSTLLVFAGSTACLDAHTEHQYDNNYIVKYIVVAENITSHDIALLHMMM